jgi:hypothetical protein
MDGCRNYDRVWCSSRFRSARSFASKMALQEKRVKKKRKGGGGRAASAERMHKSTQARASLNIPEDERAFKRR